MGLPAPTLLRWYTVLLAACITGIMAVEAKRPVTKPDFTLYHTA